MMTAFLVFILLLHRMLLSKTLFTLHVYGVSYCVWGVYGGEELRLTLHHSSPLFTLIIFFKTHYINNGSVIYYDQHQSSIMTSSCHQWWPNFAIRWRVVKSGEEWTSTLHLSQPQCLSGLQGNLWRVKSEIESGVFPTQTDSTCNQKASAES